MIILITWKLMPTVRSLLLATLNCRAPSVCVFSLDSPLTLSWLEKTKNECYALHYAHELFLAPTFGDIAMGTLDKLENKYTHSGISLYDLRKLKYFLAVDDLHISIDARNKLMVIAA